MPGCRTRAGGAWRCGRRSRRPSRAWCWPRARCARAEQRGVRGARGGGWIAKQGRAVGACRGGLSCTGARSRRTELGRGSASRLPTCLPCTPSLASRPPGAGAAGQVVDHRAVLAVREDDARQVGATGRAGGRRAPRRLGARGCRQRDFSMRATAEQPGCRRVHRPTAGPGLLRMVLPPKRACTASSPDARIPPAARLLRSPGGASTTSGTWTWWACPGWRQRRSCWRR